MFINSNKVGGRFILAIEGPGTDKDRYQAQFVVQGQKDRDENVLVHTFPSIRQ